MKLDYMPTESLNSNDTTLEIVQNWRTSPENKDRPDCGI